MGASGPFRRVMSIALYVVLAWLALVAWLALNERRLLFFPDRTLAAEPADFGLQRRGAVHRGGGRRDAPRLAD